MDRLNITTHLIAIITAFSAFTMPIALEVLNRVKSRYGSAYYMDSIEQIIGFRIQLLFRELITTLIALIGFSLFVSSVDRATFSDNYVLLSELLFSLIVSALLIKEFRFIKTVFLATRSDSLVTEHLIYELSRINSNDPNHSQEVELLIQIACYNIEKTAITSDKSTEKRLFELIEKTCINQENSIDTLTIKRLVDGLAATLTSARKTNRRDKYVSLQRDYGRLLVLFFDRKIKNYNIFEQFSNELYEESIKELNSAQYWLLRADFLIDVHTWDIQSPETITFIDNHVRRLIDFIVDKKPELLPELIDNYRKFISYDSDFSADIHRLSHLFGDYNSNHSDEMSRFTEAYKERLKNNPQDCIDKFTLLLGKYTQDALTPSTSVERYEEVKQITIEYKQEMVTEIIKEVGAQIAKRTVQHTLRVLAQKGHWRCILDCHESVSPANSRIIRLGINLLPASLNSIIQQLGKPYGYSSSNSEELSQAYIRAIPILVMYAVYCWRVQNLNKNLSFGINAITNSLNMGEKNILNANNMLTELKQSSYYAKSSVYAEAFCSHFDIKHEEAEFNKVVIPILRKTQKYLKNQLVEIKRTQPLSETIKQKYMDSILMKGKDLSKKFPLFACVSLSKDKQEPFKRPARSYNRDMFLDNTGVGRCYSDYRIIKRIHHNIAHKMIATEGSPLSTLEFENLKDNDLLIMTHKDWQNFKKSKDIDEHRNIKRHLVTSETPLETFYIYNTEDCLPIVTLYSPEIDDKSTPLGENMSNAFDFRFVDKDGQITVEIDAHIYF
jgi:hypothetical protein